MKVLKRIAAVLSVALLIGSVSITASAAVTEEQKKQITDVLFEHMWNGGLKDRHYRRTGGTVPIEDNPLASTAYMAIEAQIAVCDPELLDEFYNTDMSIGEFYEADSDFDYTKAKKLDKYKDSLLQGYEFGYVDYRNGVWQMDDIDYQTFYGYFREDAESFKLYDNDTNELLGTYPRLLDFEYLNDESTGGTGGSGGSGGTGGSTGENGGTASEYTSIGSNPSNVASLSSSPSGKSSHTTGYATKSAVTGSASNKAGSHSEYDTDNPAVTPEIASTVDAMKSAANAPVESITASNAAPEKNSNPTMGIVIVVVIAIGAAAFFLAKKNKDNSPTK